MFTKRKILLSELLDGTGHAIARDEQIAFAGKLSTPLDDRIVPVSTLEHLDEAMIDSGVVAIIAPDELTQSVPNHYGLIIAPDPMVVLSQVQRRLAEHPTLQWDRFETRIHPTAQVSQDAQIAPYDVVIGEETIVGPGAVIEPRTLIGARCSIGPQTLLGGPGFQKDFGAPGRLMSQSGGVQIGDNVTIQANCVISRALFGGFTRVDSDVLIDSLVSISHDCQIAKGVVICAKVSLSGSAKIGQSAYLGPNSTVSNGITVGAGGQISLGAVVTKNVPAGQKVSGNFALDHKKWINLIRHFR